MFNEVNMRYKLPKGQWWRVSGLPGLYGKALAIELLYKRRVYGKAGALEPSGVTDWVPLKRGKLGIVVGGLPGYWLYTNDEDTYVEVREATAEDLAADDAYALYEDADRLSTGQNLTFTGDVHGTGSLLGGSATIELRRPINPLLVDQTEYAIVKVDNRGNILSARALTVDDLPNIPASKLTGQITLPVTGNSDTASKLATPRTITLTGDGTWGVTFDGSANATAAFALSNTGVTAGTYRSLTVDAKGRVTGGTNPTSLAGYGITDAINTSKLGVAGGVATLDASGKLQLAQVPAIAITDTWVVASQAAMIALVAQRGDIAVRSDLNKSFVLSTDDPTQAANWVELKTPTDAVLTVNGQTGAVSITTITGNAGTATTWATARTVSMTGDGTWQATINGSADVSAAFTLASTGVTAGSYTKVTVDAKGRVTAGSNPTTLAGYGITDACPLNSTASTVTVGQLSIAAGFLSITGAGNNAIELGRIDGTATTPFIDFHSGATAVDYDARILASGGTGVVGGGALTITAGGGVTFTGAVTATSFNGIASRATTLNRVFNITNGGGSYLNQYTKIFTVNLTSQYQDYTAELQCHSAGSGDQVAYGSRIMMRFKQQAAFGNNPYIDCQQSTLTNTDPMRYYYVVVQNTPTTIVDVYIQNNVMWNGLSGFLVSEINSAGAGTGYLSAQPYVTTLPGTPVAFVKDGNMTPGQYQNVTVGEGGRVTSGTNALVNYTIATLPAAQVGARYWIGSLSAEAHYVGDRYVFDFQPRTWSSLNSASKTGLTAGSTCRLTDFNMQQMVYDGARWRPSSGRLLLGQAAWDGTTPLASITGVTQAAFFAAGSNVKIPAGLISGAATVCMEVLVSKTGANAAATFGVGLSIVDGPFAAGVNAVQNTTIPNVDGNDCRAAASAWFDGVNTTIFTSTGWLSQGGIGAGSFATKNTNVNTSADMFIVPYVTSANTADTFKLKAYRYWIEF